jgi:hypothetical protein
LAEIFFDNKIVPVFLKTEADVKDGDGRKVREEVMVRDVDSGRGVEGEIDENEG